jgi:hypothetical protein
MLWFRNAMGLSWHQLYGIWIFKMVIDINTMVIVRDINTMVIVRDINTMVIVRY